MNEVEFNKNFAYFKGILKEPFVFSFELPDINKKYYRGAIEIVGLNGIINILPVVTEEKNIKKGIYIGEAIKINGNLRTYNYQENKKKRVDVYIFADSIKRIQKKEYRNFALIEGYVCKEPIIRRISSGKEIISFVVANNRGKGKINYIPCVIYKNHDTNLKIGDFIQLTGRFQSRTYRKRKKEYTICELAVVKFRLRE